MLVLSGFEGSKVFLSVPPSDKPRSIVVSVELIRRSVVRLGYHADPEVEIVRDNARRKHRRAGCGVQDSYVPRKVG